MANSKLTDQTKREFYYIEKRYLDNGVNYMEAMRKAVNEACELTGMSPGDLEYELKRQIF